MSLRGEYGRTCGGQKKRGMAGLKSRADMRRGGDCLCRVLGREHRKVVLGAGGGGGGGQDMVGWCGAVFDIVGYLGSMAGLVSVRRVEE